jgi:salicylate biosynthesis isochorismate synthase
MTPLGGVEIGTPERALDRSEVRSFLRESLSARGQRSLAIVVPAPTGAPLALLDRLRRCDAFHLHDERRSITALGATHVTRLEGEQRFAKAKRQYEAGVATLTRLAHERCGDVLPIWTMGFAFAPGRARDPWAPLGDGLLTLPRWTHRVEGGSASLTLTIGPDEPSGAELALAELDALWESLAERAGTTSPHPATARHLDEKRWTRSLADVMARIESGALAKVVVARRSSVVATHDLDPVAIARRLARPGATVFCVRRRGMAFVGATPERLFRKRGRQLYTEAIAGTASLDHDPSGQRLLASAKDVHEHQLVVDGITASLSAMRAEVTLAPRALRTIGAIAHLATPIEARLPSGVSAFDVLAALHPTAAVAGTPREDAMRWIADNEPDRGWYAGPIGWIDGQGNAEAHVALRSALLVGARAYAYAGCGVVRGSDPHAEYAETALKLAPMLAALGVQP